MQLVPEAKDTNYEFHLAYFMGKVSSFEPMLEAEIYEYSEELVRELIAVSNRRSEGLSWQSVHLAGDRNTSHDSVQTVRQIKELWPNMSVFRKLLLKSLITLGAIGKSNSISAAQVANCIKSETDSRFKSNLAWLRDMHFVAGMKGERGYWLIEESATVITEIESKNSVND